MRTEAEVREQLSDMKAAQKYALENRQFWSDTDLRQQIKALNWVLGEIEEL